MNRYVVSNFYDKPEETVSRHENFANSTRLCVLDAESKESYAGKGVKQVNQSTNTEKSILATTCAGANTFPPVMVLLCVHFKQFMVKDSHPETLGVMTRSG